MKKAEIVKLINEKHQALYEWLEAHPDEKWVQGPEGNWSTGEHIVHLVQTSTAINKALKLPKFFLRYKFGTNNRENRNYDEIVEKYKTKLSAYPGAVAPISRNMPSMTQADKTTYIANLEKEKTKLLKKFGKWKDKDLDTYLLPHPLMGRMTIREVYQWTAHHIEHHLDILKERY